MAKIDEVKEVLNTLRAAFGVIVAIILTLTAGLINKYYAGTIDSIFYFGIVINIVFILILPVLLNAIVKNIKKIKDL